MEETGTLILSISFIIIVVVLVIVAIFSTRCPKCKKFFAMKEIERNLISEEKISKMENHKTYNKKGEVTGSHDVRVYGTRKTYDVKYVCKKCGDTKIERKTRDDY